MRLDRFNNSGFGRGRPWWVEALWRVVDGLLFKGGALKGYPVIEFRDGTSREAVGSRLTNCAVIDYNPADDRTEYKWVSLYGRPNRVDHCFFEGKNHQGATLVVWLDDTPDSHMVDRNHFGRRTILGRNGAETIRIGDSHWSLKNSHTTVEENLFTECDGEHETAYASWSPHSQLGGYGPVGGLLT